MTFDEDIFATGAFSHLHTTKMSLRIGIINRGIFLRQHHKTPQRVKKYPAPLL